MDTGVSAGGIGVGFVSSISDWVSDGFSVGGAGLLSGIRSV